jgi:hypothetical protein
MTAPVGAPGLPPRSHPPETSTRGFERQRQLDRECSEVTSAILLASGARASRVVVCNLDHAPVVAQAMRGLARRVAVDLVLLARSDGTGTDIAVQSH